MISEIHRLRRAISNLGIRDGEHVGKRGCDSWLKSHQQHVAEEAIGAHTEREAMLSKCLSQATLLRTIIRWVKPPKILQQDLGNKTEVANVHPQKACAILERQVFGLRVLLWAASRGNNDTVA